MLSGKQRQLDQQIGDKLFEKVLHLDLSLTCSVAKKWFVILLCSVYCISYYFLPRVRFFGPQQTALLKKTH